MTNVFFSLFFSFLFFFFVLLAFSSFLAFLPFSRSLVLDIKLVIGTNVNALPFRLNSKVNDSTTDQK